MNHHYQIKKNWSFFWLTLIVLGLWSNNVTSQTTISTETGTGYDGGNGIAAPNNSAITFVIQNTNTTAVTLSQVDAFWRTTSTGAIPKLWYTTSSISGAPTIASPAWTLIATGTALNVTVNGYLPTLTGLSFSIPAGAQYRFAIESNNGITYSGSAAATPTPNTFSSNGINLKVGNFQISAANIGYGGGFPSPANNPRFFTGRVIFSAVTPPPVAPVCAAGLSPVNGATAVAPNGGLSWTAVSGATSYDVYLGTSATPALLTNVTGTSYTFSPVLNLSTLYYYKIVPKNAVGSATGCATLSFTTANISCTMPVITTTSGDTAYCGAGSAQLRITNGALNGATQWAWYSGSCGGTLIGTGTSVTVTPATTTTYYVRGEGGCIAAGTGTCSSITVTKVSSIGAPSINPVSPICLNSVQALTINPIATTTASSTISSGTISIAIPDNTANGVSSNLIVPALPAGAVVVGIDVNLNMTHTYIGDMIFNLKAPNGAILALDKYLNGTGAAGANFVNTVISSAGTTSLDAGSPPFTATFKADALNTPITGVVVQNPAGFVSAAPNFAALYSIPNGTWTLAMADGGPQDFGILTNWSITINYTVSTTAYPAVWSPASTLFTDAAATIPYNGTTPLFQVYAKPSVTTTYTANSVVGGCTSTPTTATVTVNNPIAITAQPVNTTICEMGTATFTVTATGTTPGYQWLVNNGSGTYVAIVDNANYAGSTTKTLSVKEAPFTWNGYIYRCVVTSLTPCTQFDTTAVVTLKVNPTPVVTLTAAPYTRVLPGLSTTISVSSTPASVSYTWFRNGILIANAVSNNVTATVDALGLYKATIIDINGCSNTSAELAITDSVSTNLFIYPNPSSGQFQVRYYSVAGNTLPRVMMVFDSKGALVLNRSFTIAKPYDRMDVDFSGFSRGVYFVNLLDISGKRLASGKVVLR